MKLPGKVFRPLEEGYYRVTLKSFAHVEVEGQDGYTQCTFTVNDHPERGEQSMNIFPNSLMWTMSQLADQAGIEELTDTEQLEGKEVDLYFSHSYTRYYPETGERKKFFKKQWQIYEGN